MHETLKEVIERIKLDIARKDYSGARYITDKARIAESFTHKIYNNETASIHDPANGKVWVIFRTNQAEDAVPNFTYTWAN